MFEWLVIIMVLGIIFYGGDNPKLQKYMQSFKTWMANVAKQAEMRRQKQLNKENDAKTDSESKEQK